MNVTRRDRVAVLGAEPREARLRRVLDEQIDFIGRTLRAFDVLDALLDGLDEDLRQVFVLYEIEDMTMAAIAELLKVPPGTVASRLRRAREQFQERASRFRRKEARGS